MHVWPYRSAWSRTFLQVQYGIRMQTADIKTLSAMHREHMLRTRHILYLFCLIFYNLFFITEQPKTKRNTNSAVARSFVCVQCAHIERRHGYQTLAQNDNRFYYLFYEP